MRFEDLDERYTEEISRPHPFHLDFTRYACSDLATPEELRRGVVGYHAACEMADRNVGRVLQALDETGLREETLVVYSSDHGGSVGAHFNSGMGSMYEDSIRVPLIVAGPGVRSGAVESTPVSLLDLYQTFGEALGLPPAERMRGISLLGLLRGEAGADVPAFALSEFHGPGLPGIIFAVRSGFDKYVECVGERPILFNLEQDPYEMHDLVLERPEAPHVQEAVRRLRRMLCQVCSPEAVDARARADQRALRERLAQSGRLGEEMWKRGYERNPDRLVPREEFEP